MSANKPDDLAADLAAMVERIWKAKGMPATINKDVTSAFAKELWSGVTKGYTKDLIGIDYNAPDYNMLSHLQANVYQFSAAKNYQQLKSLTQALIGDDGKIRSYSQFKKASFEINDQHVNNWLKTEYDTAIASGQMASKWVDIQNNSSTTMLEFDAVMDSRTSAICSSLNGVIRPVDDAFWKEYYPPNHFGCRSTVRQRSGGKATPEANIVYPEKVPDLFKVNLAHQKLAFPPGHPYYNDIPDGIADGLLGVMRKDLQQTAKKRLLGKKINVQGVGNVEFSSDGIKEMINQPHADYVGKMQYVTIADVLLENSTLISIAESTKSNAKQFYYLRVKGLSRKYTLIVKEMNDGRKVLYSITDRIK